MKLIKKTEKIIDGFEGYTNVGKTKYSVMDVCPISDRPITQEEVIDADEIYLFYYQYEDLGDINLSEIEVLEKFSIL